MTQPKNEFSTVKSEQQAHCASEQFVQHDKSVNQEKELQKSRFWKLAAPCRAIGRGIGYSVRTIVQTGWLSRCVVGVLVLPIALIYHGGLRKAWSAWRNPEMGLVRPLIENPADVRKRLAGYGAWLRKPLAVSYTIALHIYWDRSVFHFVRKAVRVLRGSGWTRVREYLRTSASGAAPMPLQRGLGKERLPTKVTRRILVADYRVPRADISAGERATVGILKDLCALGYEVVFLANDMAVSPSYESQLRAFGVNVVTRQSGFAYAVDYVRRYGRDFGAFYIIRVEVAEALLPTIQKVAPYARVIFHAPDLHFLREMREAQVHEDDQKHRRALETCHRELMVMRSSDLVVLVSPAELPVLRAELPDVPVCVFPVLYADVNPAPKGFEFRRHIFFLGGFGHSPNINAVLWFAAEVWPYVHEALPDVEFHIIGAEPPKVVRALAGQSGIRVIGFLPDLAPMFDEMRIGVAPLLYGAGIKGKVAMTLGAGIPCVCTDIAAEGMGIEDGVHALVANDPQAFAQAVVTLYGDASLWQQLSRTGRVLVEERFGDAANKAALLQVLDQAGALPLMLFNDYCKRAEPVAVPSVVEGAQVDVSIIVPVYNKWELTRACLSSILHTSVGCGVRYEIILADDGSSDETLHAVEIFPGLRIARPPQNLGFLRNCNHAAQFARGRYLLLLNNDTVVLPGWLQSLYQTMEEDSSIAITGSKLLYPDGLLQEAGGLLFSDGSGFSMGRGHPRDTPIFNLVREADYISGASILIRMSFWKQVGGFDERYKNAYCEDSDLAMTARSLGMRVVYQPASEVMHFEHQSYTDDQGSSQNNITLQRDNSALLREKWGEVFQRDHVGPCEWYRAAAVAERAIPAAAMARRRTGKLNILYFSPFPSHPVSHGNRATIYQFARQFQAMGHRVRFVLLQSHEYTDVDLEDMKEAWDSVDVLPFNTPLVANGQPTPFDGLYEDGLGENIRVLCAKYDADVVFCSYIFQSKLLEFVPSYVLKVIDTHDKMGDRYEMLRQNGQPLEFFSCTPQEEGVYLRRADVVVARRAEEAQYFDTVTGRRSAIVIPHFEASRFVERSFNAFQNVGIVASANRINLAIVCECLQAIDAYLGQQEAPFVVHIAGQVKDMVALLPGAQAKVFQRPWVRLHGFVPDIAQFYAQMDAIISPVTMGTGINVKTVQAMAFGMPLLTTAWGSKGIETDEPMHRHPDLQTLTASLVHLTKAPHELQALAEVSRRRYLAFYEDSLQAMRAMFQHPKLLSMEKHPATSTQGISC